MMAVVVNSKENELANANLNHLMTKVAAMVIVNDDLIRSYLLVIMDEAKLLLLHYLVELKMVVAE